MCELLGMSARLPARLTISLDELAAHGGNAGPHRDGWGAAWYANHDAQRIREVAPASGSDHLRYLRDQGLRSRLAIAHIRLATRGERVLHNTQPFSRELGGRAHLFAHNGNLPGIDDVVPIGARFRPIGETDSEIAFCDLLAALAPLWDGETPPSRAARFDTVAAFAERLSPLGPNNFLYADGELLFVHGHRRTHPDGVLRAPGLHLLERSCCIDPPAAIDGLGLEPQGGDQRVTLVASVPLSDEAWQPLGDGELVAIADGIRLR